MTKKLATIALAALILPALAIAGPCYPDFADHGTFEYGGEDGCWLFVADSGKVFQTIGGNPDLYREGLSGVIAGTLNYSLSTTCTKGPVLELCDFTADNEITMAGTLEQIDGGCWTLNTGDEHLMLISGDHALYQEGLKVVIHGLSVDVRPYCSVNGTIEVLDYLVFGTDIRGHGSASTHLTDSNAGAACHTDFAVCANSCRSQGCVDSCEINFNSCMAKF